MIANPVSVVAGTVFELTVLGPAVRRRNIGMNAWLRFISSL